MIDIEPCLERIGYNGNLVPSLQVLRDLQFAFVYSVPFENLDIHLGKKIALSLQDFYRKIVLQRRGGFCYECNTLFHGLLDALGFDVSFVAATMQLDIAMNIEFEHMALLVHLDEDYLVDVGNGQSCLQPLQIGGRDVLNFEQVDYRLGEFAGRHALYYRAAGGDWQPRFSFTATPRQLDEYADVCHIIQTSPDSRFTQQRLVTLARENGRVTLAGRELEVRQGTALEQRTLTTQEDYRQVLRDFFGIELTLLPPGW